MTITDQPPHLIDALEQLDDVSPHRQLGTHWRVYLEDGTTLDARSTNRDMIAWERTKARHKEWPTNQDAPIFATTFVVWNALRRTGSTALTFDQFTEVAVELEKVDDSPADPTR